MRIQILCALILSALLTACKEPSQNEVPYPQGYRAWTHVKSLELKAKHPLFKDFGGLHHVYVNAAGLETLKKGGVYPDGTTFVFDLLDVKSDDAATAEGTRKVLGVMYKNAAAFAKTGGWGFEGFKGNSRDRVVAGKHETCFGCHASEWLNSPPVSVAEQRGKVVVVYAFQMLCPACVTRTGPQVKNIFDFYSREVLTVIGLHSVFEHHAAMGIESLRAYLYEFKYTYPVAVDRHSGGNPLPDTMTALGLRGTPSILLVDKLGRLRRHFFGGIEDLHFGTELGLLLGERYEAL